MEGEIITIIITIIINYYYYKGNNNGNNNDEANSLQDRLSKGQEWHGVGRDHDPRIESRTHHRCRDLLLANWSRTGWVTEQTPRASSKWFQHIRTNLVLCLHTAKINSVNTRAGGSDVNGGSERSWAGCPVFAPGIVTLHVPKVQPLHKTRSHNPATGLPEI